MSDAKYIIAKDKLSMNDDEPDLTDYVWYKDSTAEVYDVCPTYTVSELLYKLRNRYGMYSIFNCYKNLEADNISIIETLASFLIQCHKKDIGIET